MNLNRNLELMSWERSTPPANELLQSARDALKGNEKDPQLWMQLGHAYAKISFMREAADCYSMSISLDPFNWEYFRHRAHRFISCLRFWDAAADFTIAVRLNPKSWDSWYHLGLSRYLLGDYDKAAEAYGRCYELTETEKSLVSVTDWRWMTLKRLGRDGEAAVLLEKIHEGMEVGNNTAYYARLLMYKGVKTPEEILSGGEGAVEKVTAAYGVANWYEFLGQRQKSDEIIDLVLKTGDEGGVYHAFGYLAAMIDKRRRAGLAI